MRELELIDASVNKDFNKIENITSRVIEKIKDGYLPRRK